MKMITKDQIKTDDYLLQQILDSGTIHQIDLDNLENKYTPDIMIYSNGPKCWVELVMLDDGNYAVEDYKIIAEE